ncbi:hypothetical protein EDD17DRAFT_1605511 [Pisolithus thermaeus]|nr:hypothetical protein EDD17DRAFT_1605511 [Pisolithus thermaeus]
MEPKGCPWKMRQCDDSVYSVSLESSNFTARDLRTTAVAPGPIASKIAIKHPLVCGLEYIPARSTASVPTLPSGDPAAMQVDECATPTSELSDTPFVVALFGWQPPPSSSRDRRLTLSMSASRSGSFAASASMPTTPALSCASSVSCSFANGEVTLIRTPGSSASPRIVLLPSDSQPRQYNEGICR